MSRDEIIVKLRRFKDAHQKKFNFVKIGFFGSAAKNSMRETSDVDFVVVLPKPDFFDLIEIREALEREFNCPVDLVRYRENMNKFLKQTIDREAIYV